MAHPAPFTGSPFADPGAESRRELVALVAVALLAGGVTGVVGAAFRWCLSQADDVRNWLIQWAQQFPGVGILIPMAAAAACVAVARWLVTLVPEAGGSGVQRVEAAMRGDSRLESIRVLPAKFVGGVMAIGAGLALGREGPTVQMGASIGSAAAGLARLRSSAHSLEAAMAGAGLAVAFNAPLGGAVFVFEELTRSFRMKLVLATLLATASAIGVSRWMLGDAPDFDVSAVTTGPTWVLILFAVFGGLMGVLGAGYNRTVVWFLDTMQRLPQVPSLVKAAGAGALVGAVAWFFPQVVGGGDNLSQDMISAAGLSVGPLIGLLLFRWFLGGFSYCLGTPGGLFAPLLAVGAIAGALFATVVNPLAGAALPVTGFAIVGMAVFFTAVVRAPLTGVVLITEMTATTTLLVPSLLAAAMSMLTATLVRSEPIYDTLRHRMFQP